MKFPELLMLSMQRSEIPLRFEPGAEEALAKPILEAIRVWIESHEPDDSGEAFDYGQRALIAQLIDELEGRAELPEP